MCSHIWEPTEYRQSHALKYFHWTQMAEPWASPIPLIYPWGTKVDGAGLGLEPLYPDSSANILSAHTPAWPQTALCCVALNLVGHLALMLSKKSGEWSALFSLLMELSSLWKSSWILSLNEVFFIQRTHNGPLWLAIQSLVTETTEPASNLLVKLACTRLLKRNHGHRCLEKRGPHVGCTAPWEPGAALMLAGEISGRGSEPALGSSERLSTETARLFSMWLNIKPDSGAHSWSWEG